MCAENWLRVDHLRTMKLMHKTSLILLVICCGALLCTARSGRVEAHSAYWDALSSYALFANSSSVNADRRFVVPNGSTPAGASHRGPILVSPLPISRPHGSAEDRTELLLRDGFAATPLGEDVREQLSPLRSTFGDDWSHVLGGRSGRGEALARSHRSLEAPLSIGHGINELLSNFICSLRGRWAWGVHLQCAGGVVRKTLPLGVTMDVTVRGSLGFVHIDQDAAGRPLTRLPSEWVGRWSEGWLSLSPLFRAGIVRLLNLWVPLDSVPVRPMAFADVPSLNRSAAPVSLALANDQFRFVEHESLRFKWFPELQPGHAVVFSTTSTPHTSFSLPGERRLAAVLMQLLRSPPLVESESAATLAMEFEMALNTESADGEHQPLPHVASLIDTGEELLLQRAQLTDDEFTMELCRLLDASTRISIEVRCAAIDWQVLKIVTSLTAVASFTLCVYLWKRCTAIRGHQGKVRSKAPAALRAIAWIASPIVNVVIRYRLSHKRLVATYGADVATPVMLQLMSRYQEDLFTLSHRRVARLMFTTVVERAMSRRRRFLDAFRKIDNKDPANCIRRPIVILGLPRSGSSFLQRILGMQENARCFKFLNVVDPDPVEAARLAPKLVEMINMMMPSLKRAHAVREDWPEECLAVIGSQFPYNAFCASLRSMSPSFFEYLWGKSEHEASPLPELYDSIYETAMVCNAQYAPSADAMWVFKTPYHSMAPYEMLRLFPDAVFVQTHRDPAQVIPSYCRLAESYMPLVADRYDCKQLGRDAVQFWAKAMRVLKRFRQSLPAATLYIDVQYGDLLSDPHGVVERILLQCDRDVTDHRLVIDTYLREHPQHKYGPHRYGLGEYGLSEEIICENFDRS